MLKNTKQRIWRVELEASTPGTPIAKGGMRHYVLALCLESGLLLLQLWLKYLAILRPSYKYKMGFGGIHKGRP